MKNTKLFISFASVGIALVFSLLGFFMMNMSVAWFSQNDEVGSDGMAVGAFTPDNLNAEIYAYPVIGKSGETLYFGKTAGDAVIPKYDILDDVHRYVLLRIRLPEALNIVLSAETETAYFMDGETHPLLGSSDGTGADYSNCLTSIISLSRVDVASAEYDSAEAYSVSVPSSPMSFANENSAGVMEISPVITLADGEFTEIFVLVSYNEDNITRIYSENIGNTAIEGAPSSGSDDTAVIYVTDFVFNLNKK